MAGLTTKDHSRDRLGLTYVYPVLSRRAGGLSIGINLNPNNACNWGCLYCQVPGLTRGAAPRAEIDQLRAELETVLEWHASGLLADRLELTPSMNTIRDIALSGNGEPTSCPNLDDVIEALSTVVSNDRDAPVSKVLITNGSLAQQPRVRSALKRWAAFEGEIWFKLDRGLQEGRQALNQVMITQDQVARNLEACVQIAPTWIQTCLIQLDGQSPSGQDWEAYFTLLGSLRAKGLSIRGLLFYGLARPSMQGAQTRLQALPDDEVSRVIQRAQAEGYEVRHHA